MKYTCIRADWIEATFIIRGVVSIIDNQVHTGEANHFVQLVPALVNVSPFGHKSSDFTAFFLVSPVEGFYLYWPFRILKRKV